MTDFHVERLSLSVVRLGVFLTVVLAVLAAVFVWRMYAATEPSVQGWRRRILTALRAFALIFVIVAIAEPVATVIGALTRTGATALLFDTSASMNSADDPSRLVDAVRAVNRLRADEKLNIRLFGFDEKIAPMGDDPPVFIGDATDIAGAVREVASDSDIATVIVVSDGRSNSGEDPKSVSFTPSLPVHTVAVGTLSGRVDVALDRVSIPPVGRVGDSLMVDIRVKATTDRDDTFPVTISGSDGVIVAGTMTFSGGPFAMTSLVLPLEKEGDATYAVTVTPEQDADPENNTRTLSVRVMKSRFRVLVLSAWPSPDLGFLLRVINKDASIEPTVVIGSGTASVEFETWPEDSDDYDAIVVMHGGKGVFTPERARTVAGNVVAGGGMWIIGAEALPESASALKDLLPAEFARNDSRTIADMHVVPTDAGKIHIVVGGATDGPDTGEWSALPPITAAAPLTMTDTRALVLARAATTSPSAPGAPLMVTGIRGGKIIMMPFSGMWRWRLMLAGAGRDAGFYDAFVLGVLRWLTTAEDLSPLVVSTNAPRYLGGEEVVFDARLYDAVSAPIEGADVWITVDSDPRTRRRMEETKPGLYSDTARGFTPGIHRYSVEAFTGAQRYAEARGAFITDAQTIEKIDTSPDHATMASLAGQTGGLSVTASGVDSIRAAITPRISSERTESERNLTLHPLIPLAIIVFLTVEWILRKKWGLL